MALNKFRGTIDYVPEGVSLVIVKKESHPTMLKIVIDPAVEISRLAAVLRYHHNTSDVIRRARQHGPAGITVMQDGIDLARQIYERVRSANVGRTQHVTLKRLDRFQHLRRLHGIFCLALDDNVKMVRALKFFIDVPHALIVARIGPEKRRARARIADGQKLIPVKTPANDPNETGCDQHPP